MLPVPSESRRATALSLLLCLALSVGVSALLVDTVVRYRALQLDYDEAVHANRGLGIALALKSGEPGRLLHEMRRPDIYPAGHGFPLALWLLATGASTESVRAYSVLVFALLLPLTWACARMLYPRAPPMLWLVPPLVMASNEEVLVAAAQSMRELPSLLWLTVAVTAHTAAAAHDRPRLRPLAGAALVAGFFTKYNYGLAGIAALGLMDVAAVVTAPAAERRTPALRLLRLWGTVAAVLAAWVFVFRGHEDFLAFAGAQPDLVPLWSWENLGYYLRWLLGHPVSAAGLGLLLAGLAPRLVGPGPDRHVQRALALLFAVAYAMLCYTLQNKTRFGALLLPPLALGSVAALVPLAERAPRGLRVAALALLLGALAVAPPLTQRRIDYPMEYENLDGSVNEVFEIAARYVALEPGHTATVALLWREDRWSGEALRYRLASRCLDLDPPCDVEVTVALRKASGVDTIVALVPEDEGLELSERWEILHRSHHGLHVNREPLGPVTEPRELVIARARSEPAAPGASSDPPSRAADAR